MIAMSESVLTFADVIGAAWQDFVIHVYYLYKASGSSQSIGNGMANLGTTKN